MEVAPPVKHSQRVAHGDPRPPFVPAFHHRPGATFPAFYHHAIRAPSAGPRLIPPTMMHGTGGDASLDMPAEGPHATAEGVEAGPAEGEEEEEGEWAYELELSEEWAQHFQQKAALKRQRRRDEHAAAGRAQKRARGDGEEGEEGANLPKGSTFRRAQAHKRRREKKRNKMAAAAASHPTHTDTDTGGGGGGGQGQQQGQGDGEEGEEEQEEGEVEEDEA